MSTMRASLLVFLSTAAAAQYGRYGGDYGGHGSSDGAPFGSEGGGGPLQDFVDRRQKMVIAHGVLGALAFVVLFPVGSILMRLGTWGQVWLVHAMFQLFAYLVYVAAFGLGVWMVNKMPYHLLDRYHPIIGILVLVLLFFQPILGYLHHVQYKRYSRRTVWSYGHLWLGRIVIPLGMINGGLGMLLAAEAPAFLSFAPSRGQIAAYGVVAGIMWVLWMAAAVFGERRRRRNLGVGAKERDGN
ncbi:hypothetical protein ACEQ8H_006627 [Pleosporales sp. CAS-2024a]